jgi:hypothetical protein
MEGLAGCDVEASRWRERNPKRMPVPTANERVLGQDEGVDADVLVAGKDLLAERIEGADGEPGQNEGERASPQGQHDAFRQQLPEDSAAGLAPMAMRTAISRRRAAAAGHEQVAEVCGRR